MDQNEKYLTGWMACFFSNLNSKGHRTNLGLQLPEVILSKKESEALLEQVQKKIKTDKRASKFIKHQNNKDRYILVDAPCLNVLLEDAFEVIGYREREFLNEIVDKVKTVVAKYEKQIKIKCDFSEKFDELAKLFKLTDVEKKILIFCYLKETNNDFNMAFDSKELKSHLFLARVMDSSQRDAVLALSSDSNLRKYILQERTYDGLKLNNYILSFFSGKERPSEFFYKEYNDTVYDVDSFPVNKKEVELLSCLLSKNTGGMNILFHGQAGTGKTELAKSIAKALNKKVYFINDENHNDGVKRRLASIDACLNTIDIENSIIVMDEADSVLNTTASFLINGENVEKGFINKMLEQIPAKIIWIVNNVYRIENSVLRRFAFSMQFKRMTKKQRALMWDSVLKEKGLEGFLDPGEINELSEKYEVNTAGIALAVNGVEPIIKDVDKVELKSKIDIILKNHETLLYGESSKKIRNNSINYSIDGLNTDVDPKYVLDVLSSFKANKVAGIRNMNVMLSGAPGTGKTEFARYLSRELEMDMVSKTASELLGCYVGDTEKNIRWAFEEARDQGAMLFIDEADTFLYPRESAQRSWEISHTNEMLCQIESFEGVLVCATNFYKNLDSASIRRFNIKVNFDYLKEDGNFIFYKKILSGLVGDIGDQELAMTGLGSIHNLTPGDFKVVYQKNFYLKDLSHEKLVGDLILESKNKSHTCSKKVGFN